MADKPLMTELSPEVLKQLQAVQIEILDEIVRICKKYQLNYFLIYGTLIGAVRHHGFIPWDDDLDIAMSRDDYEKFMQVALKELNADFTLQNVDTDANYWQVFAKVRKNHTLFEEPSVAKMSDDIHKGIFVDIFPFDYVNKKEGLITHLRFSLSRAIIETLYYKAGVFTSEESLNYKKMDALLKRLSNRQLVHLQRRIAITATKKKKYYVDYCDNRPYMDCMYRVESFYPLIEAPFDGKMFNIPHNYDEILTAAYGDYMTLPSEEERVNHRTLRIIFDTRLTEDKSSC